MPKLISTILRTPEDFHAAIPRDIPNNLLFRQRLHKKLADDTGLYAAYLDLCREKPQILFDTAFSVYEARALPGYQNPPFILRPSQDYGIDRLKDAIDNGHNLIFDKSREEGGTEMICKMFAVYFLLYSDMSFLVGSRKEDLVDQGTDIKHGKVLGPHQTLFHKILYGLNSLPKYMQPNILKRHRFVENLDNGVKIEGEATNESFGAGNRAKAVLVDEVARIEPNLAQNIVDNIQDTSPCCIYNSTHFKFGSGHPFAKLLKAGKTEIVVLGWETNPEKCEGLYNSPEEGIIDLIDIEYYKKYHPEIFEFAETDDEDESV